MQNPGPLYCLLFALMITGHLPNAQATEAYITNQNDETLTIIDLETLAPLKTLAIPGKPAGIAVSKDGKWAYVASPAAKTVTKINTTTRSINQTFTLKGGPLGIAVHP